MDFTLNYKKGINYVTLFPHTIGANVSGRSTSAIDWRILSNLTIIITKKNGVESTVSSASQLSALLKEGEDESVLRDIFLSPVFIYCSEGVTEAQRKGFENLLSFNCNIGSNVNYPYRCTYNTGGGTVNNTKVDLVFAYSGGSNA